MNGSDVSAKHADYLKRVERLLADLEGEERQSLLAELRDQLEDINQEPWDRLGTPEEFVAEYRRSAGLETVSSEPGETRPRVTIASLISALAMPLGILILFSFGGQLIFGPFALAIEWILARISPKPLRFAWSVLAGALVGEIAVILIDLYVLPVDTVLLVLIGVPVAVGAGVLFYRTSSLRKSRPVRFGRE